MIALTLDKFLREKGNPRNSYSKLPGILVVVLWSYMKYIDDLSDAGPVRVPAFRVDANHGVVIGVEAQSEWVKYVQWVARNPIILDGNWDSYYWL